ncbi:hypothetical protein, partial [Paracoccus rhizosphaerae]|uniref:hypothetical protein n=1 Tax=Paracoccus rhizosphaerae TaxID=1133347 RepID=UPI0022404CD2
CLIAAHLHSYFLQHAPEPTSTEEPVADFVPPSEHFYIKSVRKSADNQRHTNVLCVITKQPSKRVATCLVDA